MQVLWGSKAGATPLANNQMVRVFPGAAWKWDGSKLA